MGWLDNIEGKLDDALDDVKEEIGERLEQVGASLFGNDNEGLGGVEITLTVDGLPLEPYALSADSFLSQISEYRFYCALAVGVEAGSFLDKPAQWSCTSADGLSRNYAGKVTRIDQGRILPDGQEEWVLTVASGLAALRQQSRYRIVHRRTVIELAEELLQEYGLTVDNRTHEHYPPMDWTAQVGETDLQFLQRLLARHGIWFYSTLAEQGEAIVLADDQHGASRADRGELAVTVETGGSRSVAGHAAVALRQSRRYYRWQPDRSRVHQQVCPSEAASLTQASQSSAGKVATQQTFFQFGSGDTHTSLTQARLEQERQQCRSHTILVSGAVGDLQAGQWLPVAGHGPCLVTRAALTFSSPRNHLGNSPNGFSWEAELLPLAQPFRPALPAQISLPLVFPARVEAGGPYSHVDGMASRKARIDFDGGDQPLTESSPFLRQLQPHGSLPGKDGQATGWDWPLRNGAEVLLTCLNNDPDKPLILGYAPAASQPGPVSNRNASENRILTPAGHQLTLDDRKDAQAITLNTPDGQCLLNLDANSESPLVTLACQQGAVVLRAGKHQKINVGKSSQTRIGNDSTTQVQNHSVTETDSGVIHHQSYTDTHLTANDNASLESGKNLELYSGTNSNLRIEGNARITAKKGLASKIGGSLHLQASGAIEIGGDGSGDLTLHQGGGGITIKANGTVRLFGNTVTLKGQSGVTFNGDKEYGVPKGVKADKPVPMAVLIPTVIGKLNSPATQALGLQYLWFSGEPLASIPYEIHFPDGTMRQGKLDDDGWAEETDIPAGMCVDVVLSPDDAITGELASLRQEIKKTLDAIVADQQQEAEERQQEWEDAGLIGKQWQVWRATNGALLRGLWDGATGLLTLIKEAADLAPQAMLTRAIKVAWQTSEKEGESDSSWRQRFLAQYSEENKKELVELLGFDPAAISREKLADAWETATLIIEDEECRELIRAFIEDWYEAQHALEVLEMNHYMLGAVAFEIVLGALLLATTGGAGNAAQAGSKLRHARHLKKLAEPFKKLGELLRKKRLNRQHRKRRSGETVEEQARLPEAEAPNPRLTRMAYPKNFKEAVAQLKLSRENLAKYGYRPSYTDDELLAMVRAGEVANERFHVRIMDAGYMKAPKSDVPYSGGLGAPMNAPSGKGAKYWSTTFSQILDVDHDPKLLHQKLGVEGAYDPEKEYVMIIVDTQKAAPMTGLHSIVPTFDELGRFASRELPGEFPESVIKEVMTSGFQMEYSRHFKAAMKRGFIEGHWDVEGWNRYLEKISLDTYQAKLMKSRFGMQNRLGNNEDFEGSGLTKNTIPGSPNRSGAVETFNFERKGVENKITLEKLKENDAINIIENLQEIKAQ